jgi:hypothetical protein
MVTQPPQGVRVARDVHAERPREVSRTVALHDACAQRRVQAALLVFVRDAEALCKLAGFLSRSRSGLVDLDQAK